MTEIERLGIDSINAIHTRTYFNLFARTTIVRIHLIRIIGIVGGNALIKVDMVVAAFRAFEVWLHFLPLELLERVTFAAP